MGMLKFFFTLFKLISYIGVIYLFWGGWGRRVQCRVKRNSLIQVYMCKEITVRCASYHYVIATHFNKTLQFGIENILRIYTYESPLSYFLSQNKS